MTVSRAFMEAVQAGDYPRAARYWKPSDIANIEANHDMNFEGFCKKRIKSDTYELKAIARQKGGSYLVQFLGQENGQKKAWPLYLKRIEGKWLLVQDRYLQE